MNKTIRTGVYGLLKYQGKFVVIKKSRWPFVWKYDLPGWKIEHWENNKMSLEREIIEEIWLKKEDFQISKLLTVEEDFVEHTWKWEKKNEHLIWIIYIIEILNDNFNVNYIEEWWDSNGLKLINIHDTSLDKTNILMKAMQMYWIK